MSKLLILENSQIQMEQDSQYRGCVGVYNYYTSIHVMVIVALALECLQGVLIDSTPSPIPPSLCVYLSSELWERMCVAKESQRGSIVGQ